MKILDSMCLFPWLGLTLSFTCMYLSFSRDATCAVCWGDDGKAEDGWRGRGD